MKKIILCLFLIMLGLFVTLTNQTVLAQQLQPQITVKKIEAELVRAPLYTINHHGQTILQRGIQAVDNGSADRKWLIIETELESKPEWADEVQIKFYVGIDYAPSVKVVPPGSYDVLTASVTVVNVQKSAGNSRKTLVPVFLDANTVKKYGGTSIQQFVPEIVVQVVYKGVLQDTKWWKSQQRYGRFWEQKQPVNGVLLNLTQSPWAPAFNEYYEQVKPTGLPVAF